MTRDQLLRLLVKCPIKCERLYSIPLANKSGVTVQPQLTNKHHTAAQSLLPKSGMGERTGEGKKKV